MPHDDLQEAITRLISESKRRKAVLHVAEQAQRLARECGGDDREIADRIITAGAQAGICMEMDHPPVG